MRGLSGIMMELRILEQITGLNNPMAGTVFALNRNLHTTTSSSLLNSPGFLARESPVFRHLINVPSESVGLGLRFGRPIWTPGPTAEKSILSRASITKTGSIIGRSMSAEHVRSLEILRPPRSTRTIATFMTRTNPATPAAEGGSVKMAHMAMI